MRFSIASLIDKLKLAAVGIGRVLVHWQYVLLVLLITLAFGVILTLSSSGTTEWSLLFSGLPLESKLDLLGDVLRRFFVDAGTLVGFLTVLVSLLQGLVISTLIFNLRHQQKVSSNRVGESTLASIVMIIGLGCPSCGTSLLLPILGAVTATSLVVINTVSIIIMLIALALSLYTLWKLSYIAYANDTAESYRRAKKEESHDRQHHQR